MSSVDRDKFERIVGNLLAQKPTPRSEQKTGQSKTAATVIPPTSGKEAAKSGHSEPQDR